MDVDEDFFDRCWDLYQRGLTYRSWRDLLISENLTRLIEFEGLSDEELEAN